MGVNIIIFKVKIFNWGYMLHSAYGIYSYKPKGKWFACCWADDHKKIYILLIRCMLYAVIFYSIDKSGIAKESVSQSLKPFKKHRGTCSFN